MERFSSLSQGTRDHYQFRLDRIGYAIDWEHCYGPALYPVGADPMGKGRIWFAGLDRLSAIIRGIEIEQESWRNEVMLELAADDYCEDDADDFTWLNNAIAQHGPDRSSITLEITR